MELSERIKGLRKGMGLTQVEFSIRLGITKNHYWRIEKGHSEPSISLLRFIAGVTSTNLRVLLEDKEGVNVDFSDDKPSIVKNLKTGKVTKLDIASMVEEQKNKKTK